MSGGRKKNTLMKILKNKVDVQTCNNYGGIKLMSHPLTTCERLVQAGLKRVVRISECVFQKRNY